MRCVMRMKLEFNVTGFVGIDNFLYVLRYPRAGVIFIQ